MATQVQFRGGTTSEHSTFTGVAREVTVDTTKKTVVVHDGSTAGGIPLAKESAVTSAAAITGGSINGTTVGASTASTGAFTTLSASSTVSGAGFSTYLASPPAIGGTTASTGRFTTVTATGLTSGRVTYAGASGLLSDSANLQFTGSNLGIGITPSANQFGNNLQVNQTILNDDNAGTNHLSKNAFFNSGWKYISTDFASKYTQASGTHQWSTAPSGTAGNAVTFTESMRITSAGAVGIGTSSPSSILNCYSASSSQSIKMTVGNTSQASLVATNSRDYIQLAVDSVATYVDGGTVSPMTFYTGGTERMRITSTGLVGIGTSSPVNALQVAGAVAATGGAGGYAANMALLDVSGGNAQITAIGSNTSTVGTLVFQAFSSNASLGGERMRIESSGNVGIGVTPSAWTTLTGLQVKNAALAGYLNRTYLFANAYYGTGDFRYIANDYATMFLQSDGEHRWYRAASGTAGNVITFTQAMTLDASGNLLVGTTNTTKTNTGFRVESGVANTSRGSTGSFFEFYDTGSGSRIGFISNSGGVATLYNTTSDQRLKTNIVDAPSGNIDSIKVRSFDWVGNGSHQPYGMVAQELIEVAPYAVNKPENPDEMMAVDYSKLVPMMIKEIQDLKQRIATLENK